MNLLRKILFPLVPFYSVGVFLRNKAYDLKLISSRSYEFPLICVGNISVGGTGKTPMIEYLISLLSNSYRLATLSRGYGRTTKGFHLATPVSTAETIGDEPYQLHKKFGSIDVAVCENRQKGLSKLRELTPKPQVILLDDAFQHRKVNPGFSILLTPYHKLYSDDFLLPYGDLRESRSGAERAQIVVVTKCPADLSATTQRHIRSQLKLLAHQHLFFSSIVYDNVVVSRSQKKAISSLKSQPITLVTGIANSQPLVSFLNDQSIEFEHLSFGDHHRFSDSELKRIASKKIVLTTEKDFARLEKLNHSELYYLPITIKIDRPNEFCQLVNAYVDSYF
jgi:tetraacyldisaccharide 4'-kinase